MAASPRRSRRPTQPPTEHPYTAQRSTALIVAWRCSVSTDHYTPAARCTCGVRGRPHPGTHDSGPDGGAGTRASWWPAHRLDRRQAEGRPSHLRHRRARRDDHRQGGRRQPGLGLSPTPEPYSTIHAYLRASTLYRPDDSPRPTAPDRRGVPWSPFPCRDVEKTTCRHHTRAAEQSAPRQLGPAETADGRDLTAMPMSECCT